MSRVATLEVQFVASLDAARAKWEAFKKDIESNPLNVGIGGSAGGVTLGGTATGAGTIPGAAMAGAGAGAVAAGGGVAQLVQQMQAVLTAIPGAIAAGFANVGQHVGAAAAGGSGGGTGGARGAGGGGYFSRWGQLTRLFGVGYGIREAFSGYNASETMNAGMIQAGGNQAAQARAQLGFSATVGGMFFGIGDILTGGRQSRAETERILADAEQQGQVDEARAGGASFRRDFGAEASQATAGSNYERRQLQIKEQAFRREQQILKERNAELIPLSAQQQNKLVRLQGRANATAARDDAVDPQLSPAQQEQQRKNKYEGGISPEESELREYQHELSLVNRAANQKYDRSFAQSRSQEFYDTSELASDRGADARGLKAHSAAQGLRSESNAYDAAEMYQLHAGHQIERDRTLERLLVSTGKNLTLSALGIAASGFGGLPGLPGAGAGIGIPASDAALLGLQHNADEADESIRARDLFRRRLRIGMNLSTHAAETAALMDRDPTGARVAGQVGSGLLSARLLKEHGDYDLAGQSISNSIGDLNLTKQQYLDQFRGTAISNFTDTTNPRDNESPTAVLKKIDDGIQALRDDLKNLASD